MHETELEIVNNVLGILRKHYKRTKVTYAFLKGDYLTMMIENCAWHRYPWIAKRILDNFPQVRVVHFTGNWTEAVYTRETLKWAGYKMKEHKNKKVC